MVKIPMRVSFITLLVVVLSSSLGSAKVTVSPPSADQVASIFSYSGNLKTRDLEMGADSPVWKGFGKEIWCRCYESTNAVFWRVCLTLFEGGTYLTLDSKKRFEDDVKKGGFYAPQAVDLPGKRRGYIDNNSSGSFTSLDGKYDVLVSWWQTDSSPTNRMHQTPVIIRLINIKDKQKSPWEERAVIFEPAIEKLDSLLFSQQ